MNYTIEERFWYQVDKNGPLPENRPELGTCWQWLGYKNPKGYGRFWNGDYYNNDKKRPVKELAYRWAYKRYKGPVPLGLTLDHLCKNTSCVNYNHLEPVSNYKNIMRGNNVTAQQTRRFGCPRGHSYSLDNTYMYPNLDKPHRLCCICNPRFKPTPDRVQAYYERLKTNNI